MAVKKERPPTSWNYQPIVAQGLAKVVGASSKEVNEQFGQPIKTIASGYSFWTAIYPTKEANQYIEVTFEDSRATSIKVIGEGAVDLQPFTMGMSMYELTQITTIYPNFTFNYENQEVSFEMMDEDMNYRPLVAFDNDTFAMLFFNQVSSQLYAVVYLDQEMLLKLAPYHITSGIVPNFAKQTKLDWPSVNKQKGEQSIAMFNLLRQLDGYAPYHPNSTLQLGANNALRTLLTEQSEFLSTERSQMLKRVQLNQTAGNFVLNSNEMDELLKKIQLPQAMGYFETPVYDPTFTILSWYSNAYLHARFMHREPEMIGVSFDEAQMFVLLQEMKNETHQESNTEETKEESNGSAEI